MVGLAGRTGWIGDTTAPAPVRPRPVSSPGPRRSGSRRRTARPRAVRPTPSEPAIESPTKRMRTGREARHGRRPPARRGGRARAAFDCHRWDHVAAAPRPRRTASAGGAGRRRWRPPGWPPTIATRPADPGGSGDSTKWKERAATPTMTARRAARRATPARWVRCEVMTRGPASTRGTCRRRSSRCRAGVGADRSPATGCPVSSVTQAMTPAVARARRAKPPWKVSGRRLGDDPPHDHQRHGPGESDQPEQSPAERGPHRSPPQTERGQGGPDQQALGPGVTPVVRPG